MKHIVKKGQTSYLVAIFIQDSSSTTGAGLTGLTSGSSGLVCYRARADDGNAAGTQITLSGGTRGTWSSGGFVEKDATNMPGVYELGIPDAALATGSNYAIVMLKGATNMAPLPIEFQLVAYDPLDSVHLGLSAIPNATAGAANGLVICGTNAPVTITGSGDALTISSTGGNGNGINVSGNGSGDGIKATAGATGRGVHAIGGATSGAGFRAEGTAGNANAIEAAGQGSADGISATGGATGRGIHAIGGATSGAGFRAEGTAGNSAGMEIVGQGSAAGGTFTGGATGDGLKLTGGATTGNGITALAATSGAGMALTGGGSSGNGMSVVGAGSGDGVQFQGGATGRGMHLFGGATSGSGLRIEGSSTSGNGVEILTTSGDGLSILPTAGNGIVATANGTSKHGAVITGGTAGTSDGVKAVAGTGGVDIRGNITGNVTGNLSGSVGSVTGAVGSVTARVTANADQWAGGTIPAPNVTGVPLVDLKYTLGTLSPAAAGYVALDWGQVTNKTTANALTNTTISTTQVVASVSGAVGSVTAGVTVTTNNDKTGYALTVGERTSIADALLDRDMSVGTDSGSSTVRTVRQALRFLRNKWAVAAGTLTVYKEDDVTASWTAAVSTDATAVPITGNDPAGP